MEFDTETIAGSYDHDLDYSPALLGELIEFIATPYGTYGKGGRLLRSVIIFGTASPNGKKKKSFVLDDMTGNIVVEVEDAAEMPEIPCTVLVIGTLERRDGINNVKARHVKQIPVDDVKIVGTWHTLKAIESMHADAKAISRACELLKKYPFLSLMRRSQLTSNQVSLRHVLFAVNNMQNAFAGENKEGE